MLRRIEQSRSNVGAISKTERETKEREQKGKLTKHNFLASLPDRGAHPLPLLTRALIRRCRK